MTDEELKAEFASVKKLVKQLGRLALKQTALIEDLQKTVVCGRKCKSPGDQILGPGSKVSIGTARNEPPSLEDIRKLIREGEDSPTVENFSLDKLLNEIDRITGYKTNEFGFEEVPVNPIPVENEVLLDNEELHKRIEEGLSTMIGIGRKSGFVNMYHDNKED